jgi:hypothetical protein
MRSIVFDMEERRVPQELSTDPGDLIRVYQEYVDALERQLAILLHGQVPDPRQ